MLRTAVKYGILAFIVYRAALIVMSLGIHKTVYKHHPGPCRQVTELAEGSEDMEIIPGDKVLITTGLRFMWRYNSAHSGRVGRVYMMDLNNLDQPPAEVVLKNYPGDRAEADLHGISVWVDKDTGEVRVFIVNHPADYSVVEIFTYKDDENALYHQKTCGVGDQNLHVLNDVIGVGLDQFYVTNYLYSRYGWGKLENLLQPRWGSIVYYDGSASTPVQRGFFGLNGIHRSPDARLIYVAHRGDQAILVYERNADNSLTLKQLFPIYTSADNIVVDEDSGDLWLGCHPVRHRTTHYLEDPTQLSPSQVLRLRTEDGLITDMTEAFLDDGKLISGSSVALYAKGKLLIGSIASQTAICDVKYV